MRLLITAFEPFGGRSCNTSLDLLKALESSKGDSSFSAYSYEILPVHFYHAWPKLSASISKTCPDAVILMGEKAANRIFIETTAHNRRRSKKGIIPINRRAPNKIRSPLSLPRMRDIAVSHSAGDYLCNFIYFKILRHKPALPCIFVHLPALGNENWRACQKSYTSRMRRVITSVAKAIDGTNANVSTREKKKGAYHG